MKKYIVFRLLAIIWASAIAIFSLLPGHIALSSNLWDKLEHGLAFLVLTILLCLSRLNYSNLKIWALSSIYGILIESGQIFSPNRFADPNDAVADALGAFIGILLFYAWKRT